MTTSARDVTARLASLLSNERAALADFLIALADFDQKRIWLELGHRSLFSFLHRELGLSKGAAYYRQTAAQLVQQYPEIVAPLRDGKLCLTSVVELSKAITPENRNDVLPRYFHLSKTDARAVTAALRPAEVVPVRSVVTAVRPALSLTVSAEPKKDDAVGTGEVGQQDGAPQAPNVAAPNVATPNDATPNVAAPNAAAPNVAAPAPPARRATADPLTAELARLHVTVPATVVKKIAAARDALSHTRPDATDAEVIEAALDLLLAQAEKRKGVTDRPRKTPPSSSNGRRIPAHVKREVWKRDGGCCAWRLDSGGVCGSRRRLEFDHIVPAALGGPSTVDNVRVACQAHNQHAARLVFGDDWMDRFTRRRSPRAKKPRGQPETSPP